MLKILIIQIRKHTRAILVHAHRSSFFAALPCDFHTFLHDFCISWHGHFFFSLRISTCKNTKGIWLPACRLITAKLDELSWNFMEFLDSIIIKDAAAEVSKSSIRFVSEKIAWLLSFSLSWFLDTKAEKGPWPPGLLKCSDTIIQYQTSLGWHFVVFQ